MSTTVSTLQELLEAIASANDNDSIQLLDSISITSSTEFSSDKKLHIDLNSNTIFISAENGILITGGNYTISNGFITSAVPICICIDGADTVLTLANDLTVTGTGTVVKVQKKATLNIAGAYISSTTGDGPVIDVEGYTIATANSKVEVSSGLIDAGDAHAIDVHKRGIAVVTSGVIRSETSAISKADDSATVVTVTGGSFKGSIPDGAVDTETYAISGPDETGIYTVIAIDNAADSDINTDSDDDIHTDANSDVDQDTNTDADVDADVDVDSDSDIDTVDDTSVDTEPDPTPTTDLVTLSASNEEKTSAALKKTTRVYATPSIKHPIDDIIGAVRILDGEYSDPTTGITFKRIEYTLPGNGRKAVGFVISSTVTGE